jgi:hypothetical protein
MEKLLAKGGCHHFNSFAFIVWSWNNFNDAPARKSIE